MFSILFAILTTISWGTSDIFGATSSRRIGSYQTTFWVTVISAAALSLVAPFYLNQLRAADLPAITLAALLGLVLTFTYLAFTEALRIGDPSVVGTIAGSFVAPVVILSIIFLHSTLNAIQAAAILVVILGMTLASLDLDQIRKRQWRPDRSIVLAFLAMAGWSIYFAFIKVPVEKMGWFWPEYIAALAGLAFVLIFWSRKAVVNNSRLIFSLVPAAGAAMLGSAGALAYNAALLSGDTALIAPIAGSYPVIFVFLSYVFFKQSVSTSQKIGMAITLMGIVFLAAVTVT